MKTNHSWKTVKITIAWKIFEEVLESEIKYEKKDYVVMCVGILKSLNSNKQKEKEKVSNKLAKKSDWNIWKK